MATEVRKAQVAQRVFAELVRSSNEASGVVCDINRSEILLSDASYSGTRSCLIDLALRS